MIALLLVAAAANPPVEERVATEESIIKQIIAYAEDMDRAGVDTPQGRLLAAAIIRSAKNLKQIREGSRRVFDEEAAKALERLKIIEVEMNMIENKVPNPEQLPDYRKLKAKRARMKLQLERQAK